MKIAFIVNNYPPRTGGVELHVRALAAQVVAQGHEALVITLGPAVGVREDDGIEVRTLPERWRVADILGFPYFGTRRRLTQFLRERNVDVVSVHTRFFPMTFVGWRAARRAGLPVVHTEHGSDHVTSDSFVIRAASRFVDFTLGRMVLRGANRVLGVSEDVTAFVQRLAGVHADVFYNAIDLGEPGALQPSPRPAHLVFVGRLVPGKGWEDFLEVVAGVHATTAGVTAEVLGDGADRDKLRERARELGLEQLVAIRGRVSQAEVRASLAGATLVNPTRLSEGFQTTLLEAIAEAGMVVTYPVPGAAALAAAGAPVLVTDERSPDGLLRVLRRVLASPPSPIPFEALRPWGWQERGAQYLEICESARRAAR